MVRYVTEKRNIIYRISDELTYVLKLLIHLYTILPDERFPKNRSNAVRGKNQSDNFR